MAVRKQILVAMLWVIVGTTITQAQRNPPALPPPVSPRSEFLQAADEVLADMSKLLALPVLEPLKRSVRSREEIRDFLVQSMRDDKGDAKRHADQKALETLGLIPKGYPLDQKLLALLTEQIAGMYDEKSREFFIADWTSPADQRMIMAHELTHALEDQHFGTKKWEEAAKANDDDELARDSFLEGSATLAMFDYQLHQLGRNPGAIFDMDPSLLLSLMFGDLDKSPELADAPQVLRDEMLFPYGAGAVFSLQALKALAGWSGLPKVFANPPASTQQIMHPELYLRGVTPVAVTLPPLAKIIPSDWKKLDENLLGEFGLNEVLKQFLGAERADDLASSWIGDRYAIFERQPGDQTLLVIRLRLASDDDAARLFGGYSEALERKDDDATELMRRPNFFSFETPEGGVFLRCFGSECLTAEGTTREVFDAMTRAMGWPDGPAEPRNPVRNPAVTARALPPGLSPLRPFSVARTAPAPALLPGR